ncbi:MAG: hypothetical protein HY726_14700 [Candidatus Rokubacteria bacterium]|nr:hypothetical protein [Candidatus Rokubacteria bacterium]
MLLLAGACVLACPLAAAAVEYRLRVASLYEEAFYALLGADGTRREGPVQGPPRLIEALDRGEVPVAVLLGDREVVAARPGVASAFGAVRVRAESVQEREDKIGWSELRWQGKPGEQSVWVIAPSTPWFTEVRDVALKGAGQLIRVIPHRMALSRSPAPALGIPLAFVEAREGDPALWRKYLAPVLDLSEGVGVVVAVNRSSGYADYVFIVVRHAPVPTTYSVVLAWKQRRTEIEAGGREDDQERR